jgi:hypothetical protein
MDNGAFLNGGRQLCLIAVVGDFFLVNEKEKTPKLTKRKYFLQP